MIMAPIQKIVDIVTSSINKLQKLLLTVRKALERNGLWLTIFKGGRRLSYQLTRKIRRLVLHHRYDQRVDELMVLIEQHSGFFDLLHIPLGWSTLMFQRYQHISWQAAQLGGLALYGGHPDIDRGLFVYQMQFRNLYVFDASDSHLVKKILKHLKSQPQSKVIRVQSIDLLTSKEQVYAFLDQGFTIIYEYIDVISPIITGLVPKFVYDRHLSLLQDERIIVAATANRLADEIGRHRKKNFILNTNGVDVEHWRQTLPARPKDMLEIMNRGIIVGYHGALAEWIDYELLRLIADHGNYELVLLGLEHDMEFRKSGLSRHHRVHFLGSKSYFELSAYARCYDVAILPFKKNTLTDSISPVKIFEYMAAQKPVVTTDLVECNKYASCLVAKTRPEFMDKLNLAVQLRTDPQYLSTLEADARNNSWQQKTIELLRFAGVLQN